MITCLLHTSKHSYLHRFSTRSSGVNVDIPNTTYKQSNLLVPPMSKPIPSSTSFGANITPTYWSASQILGHTGYSDHQGTGHGHHHHHAGDPHDQYYTYNNHNHSLDDEHIDDYESDLVDEVLEVSTSECKSDLNISDETSSTLPMLVGDQYVPHERNGKKRQREVADSRNISQV